jgi:hypothetical protein
MDAKMIDALPYKGYGRIFILDGTSAEDVERVVRDVDSFEHDYMPSDVIAPYKGNPLDLVYLHKFAPCRVALELELGSQHARADRRDRIRSEGSAMSDSDTPRGDAPASEMTIRERFAMAAMQGLCAQSAWTRPETSAEIGVECADALLAALAKERAGE